MKRNKRISVNLFDKKAVKELLKDTYRMEEEHGEGRDHYCVGENGAIGISEVAELTCEAKRFLLQD